MLIFLNIHRRRDQLLAEEKLFLLLVYSDALILVLDALMWVLDGQPGAAVRSFNIAATTLYYAMNPVICMVWYLYVHYSIYRDIGRLKRIVFQAALPAAVNLALSVSSIFTGVMFTFDANNTYHRGQLFFLMALISFFYMALAWILSIVRRRSIPKQEFYPITIFMFLPVAGGVIQVLFYGVNLIWACVTFSTLIVFVHIQNHRLYTDYLTGLNNRRQLDLYLRQRVQLADGGMLAGLMIDIDDFKKINDTHGHSAGDQALVDTAEILKKTFRKNDFISRYGGDEFVVVMSLQEKEDLGRAIGRLSDNVAAFNARKTAPYTISLSIGYDCFLDQQDTSGKDFIERLDDLMYKDKHGGKDE